MKQVLFSFIFFSSTMMIAQSQRQADLSVGLTSQIFQDQGFSTLAYQGTMPTLGLSLSGQKPDKQWLLEGAFSRGSLSPSLENPASFVVGEANRLFSRLHYGQTFKVIEEGKLTAFAGVGLVGYLDLTTFNHMGNNPFSYELAFSIVPEAQASYQLSNRFSLTGGLMLPLLSYSIRPEAFGLFPLEDLDLDLGGIFANGRISSFDKVFFVGSQLSAAYHRQNGDELLSLSYRYFGGINRSVEPKGWSNHALVISLPFYHKSIE